MPRDRATLRPLRLHQPIAHQLSLRRSPSILPERRHPQLFFAAFPPSSWPSSLISPSTFGAPNRQRCTATGAWHYVLEGGRGALPPAPGTTVQERGVPNLIFCTGMYTIGSVSRNTRSGTTRSLARARRGMPVQILSFLFTGVPTSEGGQAGHGPHDHTVSKFFLLSHTPCCRSALLTNVKFTTLRNHLSSGQRAG